MAAKAVKAAEEAKAEGEPIVAANSAAGAADRRPNWKSKEKTQKIILYLL